MSWRNKKLRLPKGMREFPKEATDLSPEKVVKMYNDGFAGIKIDPEAKEELMEMQPVPDGDIVAMQVGLADTGAGKLSIPFVYTFNQYPKVWPSFAQETGDCHSRETLVRLTDGSQKRIEDIVVGDTVVSAKGNAQTVSKLIRKTRSKTGTINLVHFKNDHRVLKATPDHLVLTVQGNSRVWKEVSELAPGDIVLRPNPVVKSTKKKFDLVDFYEQCITEDEPKETRIMPAKKGHVRAKCSKLNIPRYITLDDRLAWLVGLYAAEGSMDYENGKPSRVTFNIGSHRIDHAVLAKQYLESIFRIKVHLYSVKSKPNVTFVRIQNVLVAGLFSYLVPGNVYDKSVNDLFFSSSKSVRLAVIRGWLDGDGYLSPSGDAQGTSVSYDLISDIVDLCTSCKINITRYRKHLECEGHKEAFTIHTDSLPIWGDGSITPSTKGKLGVIPKLKGDICYLKDGTTAIVSKVTEEDFDDEVFCLVVENDHSFIADGFASHNCTSRAGKNTGLVLLGVEAALGEPDEETGEIEGFPEYPLDQQSDGIICYENIYGDRGHRGQGASCSRLIIHVTRDGGLLLRKNYPEIDLDLTKPNTKLAISWGARGTPTNVKELAHANLIRNAVDVPTHEVARDFIHNGFPIWVCSDLGWSDQCDANGYAKRQGSWGHSWIVMGYDDRPETIQMYGFPLFLYCHDWGLWSSNKKGILIRDTNILIPPGTFWADARLLDQCDMTALSGLKGWKRQVLPDLGGTTWG